MPQPAATSIATGRRRSSGPRVGELIDAFLDQLASDGASTHTLGAYRRDLRGVADRMAVAQGLDDVSWLRLSQVDSACLEAGMAAWATDHAPASVARAWAAWSSFFTTSSRRASPGPTPRRRHSVRSHRRRRPS